MGFLRRLLGGDQAPDWTGGMSGDEFKRFLDLVAADQRRRDHPFRVDGDGLFVDRPEGGEPWVFGLSNLAMLCHGISPIDWPEAIATHFTNIEAAMSDQTDLDDFEQARPFLKVRVYAQGDMGPKLLESVALRPLTTDLAATLVLDLPTTVRTVNKATAAEWPEPFDRLFAIGTEHLADEVDTYERATLELDGAARLERLVGDSFFVASQVLRLEAFVGEAANGVVVAIPNRHLLLWHVLETAAHARTALMVLTSIGAQAFEEGPGSVSPHPHWWHRGALTPLPSTRHGKDKYEIDWPDAFLGLLDGLPAGPST